LEGKAISHYSDINLLIKDRQCLLEALLQMGWALKQIEIHDVATHLYGFEGDKRSDLANIIIRRQHVGFQSNDIGFRLEADGTYTAIISEYDQLTYDTTWLNTLKQNYGVVVTETQARRRGMTVKKTKKEDGTIQLVLLKGR
jgi:hypothetical protein